MTSVVVYKRQSNIDIIPEDDYYTELSRKESYFNFFNLPEPICMEVVAQLNLRDTRAIALTCRAAWAITRDQLMWKRKLWLRAQAINLGLSGPNFKPDVNAGMLVRDPLLVNNKLLYEILDPDSCACSQESQEDLDMGHLLSKMSTPNTSTALSDMLDQFFSIFNGGSHQTSVSDPFSRGEGAPTYLLFGMPETKVSKKLVLSFIASNGSTFDTVGFVKGKPGGVGGGVTVKYSHHLLNLLLVRRARPRLLVHSPAGTAFHPDVAEVIPQVDGLICYMDATCTCSTTTRTSAATKTSAATRTSAATKTSAATTTSCHHTIDILELEAMLRTVPPHLTPPVLVLLARLDHPHSAASDLDHDVDINGTTIDHSKAPQSSRHRPVMLHTILESLDLPWAVCEVEVKTLSGVHRGLNWLLHRTLKLKNG